MHATSVWNPRERFPGAVASAKQKGFAMNTYSEGMEPERNGAGSVAAFVCGAALGATVGAAIALIMAPATGRDTREYLKRRGNELGHDAMERGRDAWRSQSERVKSAVSSGLDRAGEAMHYARERGESAYRDARESFKANEPGVMHTSYQSRAQRTSE
jgi:gas vesicle protein